MEATKLLNLFNVENGIVNLDTMERSTAPHKHIHNVRYRSINDCRTACSCCNANGMEAEWSEHDQVWFYYAVTIEV